MFLGLEILLPIAVVEVLVTNIVKRMVDRRYRDYVRESLRKWAKKDISTLGVYSNVLTTSVTNWIYAIEVFLYKEGIAENVYDVLLDWNSTYNVDKGTMILRGIESAHTKFLQAVDDAREEGNGAKPKFKCDSEYNYHVLPKTLMHNDYINTDALLDIIDAMVKVKEEESYVGV